MDVLICIDDTDDLTKTTSTGKIAEAIEKRLTEAGVACGPSGITRHQLLLDERIRYTSHNSSMCMKLETEECGKAKGEIVEICVDAILSLKAAECGPGLCVCFPANLSGNENLISFGLSGQRKVLTKDMAYALAEKEGVHLSEHGGDGNGVIGALCGAGLRLSGFDGWFRGKINLESLGIGGKTVSGRELAEKTGVQVLCDGKSLLGDEEIETQKEAKCLLWNHQKAIAVRRGREKNAYEICDRKTAKDALTLQFASCEAFEYDNDTEERTSAWQNGKTCLDCLFRRWTAYGFECARAMK